MQEVEGWLLTNTDSGNDLETWKITDIYQKH